MFFFFSLLLGILNVRVNDFGKKFSLLKLLDEKDFLTIFEDIPKSPLDPTTGEQLYPAAIVDLGVMIPTGFF